MTEASVQLKKGYDFPLRIATVAQSKLPAIQERYTGPEFNTELTTTTDEPLSFTTEENSTDEDEVDRLLAGLPFSRQRQGVAELAAEIEAKIGTGDRGHLSIFDTAQPKVRELLVQITLARCYPSRNNALFPFALREEPFKVIKELGGEYLIYEDENGEIPLSKITLDDVIAAIESGALKVKT